MKKKSSLLCGVYFVLSIVALIGCWYQNWYYVPEGLLQGGLHFWQDLLVTAASRSITIDIGLFSLCAAIWMVIESKKYGIKNVWMYLLFGLLIAISVTFPLFLIAREFKMNSLELKS